jgi:hypothetical protein
MHRLAEYRDTIPAEALLEQLRAAGIQSTITTSVAVRGGLTTGFTTVWIEQSDDLADAKRILAAFTEQQSADATDLTCANCGYELTGHHGRGRCPECGHPIRAPQERLCPHCGESVPDSFTDCWNCGKTLDP